VLQRVAACCSEDFEAMKVIHVQRRRFVACVGIHASTTPQFGRLRVAVCCSVLQCVAVCCSVLQCVAVCYSMLQWELQDIEFMHVRYRSFVVCLCMCVYVCVCVCVCVCVKVRQFVLHL